MADEYLCGADRKKMKIIFMGTPEFALPGLETLYNRGIEIAGVVTRPDRPAGRGREPTPPPVKVRAQSLGLDIRQPGKLKDPAFIDWITHIGPDLFVVSAYGKFIPADLLACAGEGGINLHPSLLPRYRGAAPIQWALINGDVETGVTVISIAGRMDAGDIFAREPVSILQDDNGETLARRLAERGGELLADVVGQIERGKASPHPQDESEVTLAPRLSKEDGWIDWRESAARINNRVRGLYPWPGAFTTLQTAKGDKTLKIIRSAALPGGDGTPGEVLESGRDTLTICTGEGGLSILELQIEGKRPLSPADFLRGHRIASGEILGDRTIKERAIL